MPLKPKILCFFPGPVYRPDQIDFRKRFEMLSEYYEGEIYTWSSAQIAKDYDIGSFKLKAFVPTDGPASKIALARHIVRSATKYRRKSGVDLIICYEAVFTGVIGAVLKRIFQCKLIVELNSSSLSEAIKMEDGSGLSTSIKIALRKAIRRFTLWNADGIKRLTERQAGDFRKRYPSKQVFGFHDFVATSFFMESPKRVDKYFLLVGYPFHRKGVDVLVRAFEEVLNNYPEFQLILIGHDLELEAKKRLGMWDNRIIFKKPMFYDELQKYFLNCYGLIIPSREEGMGRVILEAMACGKPIVGSNVGGIPSLIAHNVNGLLFESENISDLRHKIEELIARPEQAGDMGKQSQRLVVERFSDQKYVEYFRAMTTAVLGS